MPTRRSFLVATAATTAGLLLPPAEACAHVGTLGKPREFQAELLLRPLQGYWADVVEVTCQGWERTEFGFHTYVLRGKTGAILTIDSPDPLMDHEVLAAVAEHAERNSKQPGRQAPVRYLQQWLDHHQVSQYQILSGLLLQRALLRAPMLGHAFINRKDFLWDLPEHTGATVYPSDGRWSPRSYIYSEVVPRGHVVFAPEHLSDSEIGHIRPRPLQWMV